MRVLKYSSMDEVTRIMDRLQVVKEGEVIVGVVGISQEEDAVDIGPLAVDRQYQVFRDRKEALSSEVSY